MRKLNHTSNSTIWSCKITVRCCQEMCRIHIFIKVRVHGVKMANTLTLVINIWITNPPSGDRGIVNEKGAIGKWRWAVKWFEEHHAHVICSFRWSPSSLYWTCFDRTRVLLRGNPSALIEISKTDKTFTGSQNSVIDVAVTIGSFFWYCPKIKYISTSRAGILVKNSNVLLVAWEAMNANQEHSITQLQDVNAF